MTCNALARYSCGRTIRPGESALSFGVHVNRGNQPHTFETHYQCPDCARKQQAMRDACSAQASWRERRQAVDLSIGEMADRLGLSRTDYSGMEAQRMVATEQVRQAVEQILQGGKQ